jgi:Ca2+-binding EF-hand superfamily protein
MEKVRKLSAVLGDDDLLKEKAEEYFRSADKSKSGTLNDDEVLALCRKISEHGHFKTPTAEKIHELLTRCDRSQDGVLHLDEFTTFFRVLVGSALKKRLEADVAQEAALLTSVTESLYETGQPTLPAAGSVSTTEESASPPAFSICSVLDFRRLFCVSWFGTTSPEPSRRDSDVTREDRRAHEA